MENHVSLSVTISPIANSREKILRSLSDLFYRNGTYVVGIDHIVDHLKVTRATLYRHFGGKEGMVLAYLQRRHEQVSIELEELTSGLPGEAAVLATFDSLIAKTSSKAFRGCAFLLAATENPRSEPIHEIARQHKAYLHALFLRIGQGWASDELIEQLIVVYEGALAASVLRPEAHPALAARSAAEILLHVHKDRAGAKGTKQ